MMSRIQFVSGLVIAGLLAGTVMAEADAPKTEVVKKEVVAKAKVYKGALAAKPADAAANVLAVLTVKGRGKDAADTTYSVIATDEAVKTKITDLLAKGGDVAIKGLLSEDGKSITASDAVVAPVKATAGHHNSDKAPAPKAE